MEMTVLKLILLIGAGQGWLLGFLLLTRKANRDANRILAALLFLLGVHLVLVAFDEREFFMRFPHLSRITWSLPLLYGPLVLIFVRRMTHIAPSFAKKELLFFLPFLTWVAILAPYYLQPAEVKRAYLDNFELSLKDDFGILNQLTNFFHLFFFGVCIAVYHRHDRRIRHLYSDLRRVRMTWLRDFLYLTLAVILFGILIFYARKFEWPYLGGLYPSHFIGVVLLIYWMAYRALSQPALFSADEWLLLPEKTAESFPVEGRNKAEATISTDEAPPPGPKTDPALRENLAAQLIDLMEKDKLFLNSELTLRDLTDHLQSNKQYVSETLNVHIGKNFYDFVNDYRIEEFKRLLADPAHRDLTLLALAFQAGFNSKATFNAVFKKRTGLTPSAFHRQVKAAADLRG